MNIKDVVEKYDLPDDMYYLMEEETLLPTIVIAKGKYLLFFKDKINYMSGEIIFTIPDSVIEKYLLLSKRYLRHIRTKKLRQINDK